MSNVFHLDRSIAEDPADMAHQQSMEPHEQAAKSVDQAIPSKAVKNLKARNKKRDRTVLALAVITVLGAAAYGAYHLGGEEQVRASWRAVVNSDTQLDIIADDQIEKSGDSPETPAGGSDERLTDKGASLREAALREIRALPHDMQAADKVAIAMQAVLIAHPELTAAEARQLALEVSATALVDEAEIPALLTGITAAKASIERGDSADKVTYHQALAETLARTRSDDGSSHPATIGRGVFEKIHGRTGDAEFAKAAAGYSAEQVGASQNLSLAELKAVAAELDTSIGGDMGMTPEERLSYIGQSVAGAVGLAGGDTRQQRLLAADAMQRAGIGDSGDINAATARVSAVLSAREEGLSTADVEAAGVNAATKERLIGDGVSALEARITANRRAAETRDALSTHREQPQSIPGSDGGDVAGVQDSSLSRGQAVHPDDIVRARSVAEEAARSMGLTQLEIEVAGVKAQAQVLAGASVTNEDEVALFTREAVLEYLESKDVPERLREAIADRAMAQHFHITPVMDGGLHRSGSASLTIEGRIAKAESALADLVLSFAETNRQIVQLTQVQYEQSERQAESVAAIRALAHKVDQISRKVDQRDTLAAAEIQRSIERLAEQQGKLVANQGWISNRLCEEEARSGAFSNQKACAQIYAKHQDKRESTGTTSRPPAPETTQPSVADIAAPVSRKISRHAQSTIHGVIPATRAPASAATGGAENDACESASDQYSYSMISQDKALIVNQWGASRMIAIGSVVEGLGRATRFVVSSTPRHIIFENGVICR